MTARFAARFGHERLRRLLLTTVIGYVFVLVVVGVAACLGAGCGAASRVGVAVACPSLMLSVAEAPHLSPERAHADIDSVAAVCRRLQVDVDAGTVAP